MGNQNSKTGILIGQLQSYCVACRIVAKNNDVEAHVLTDEHKENFEKCPFVEDSKLQTIRQMHAYIRKVPRGYYCDRCNCFIRSLGKVKVHMSTPTHTQMHLHIPHEENPQIDIKQTDEGIIAFKYVKIDDLAWNGIINDSCLVCDADVEDVKAHMDDDEHIFKIFQFPVEKKYYYLYRKVETSVQCLICNTAFPENDLDDHFDSANHKAEIDKACDGKIVKTKIPEYDINKGLRIKDFISPCPSGEQGICLMCHWFIANKDRDAHIKGYHHQNLLKLHNKWLEKKKTETLFIIKDDEHESNKANDVTQNEKPAVASVGEKDDSKAITTAKLPSGEVSSNENSQSCALEKNSVNSIDTNNLASKQDEEAYKLDTILSPKAEKEMKINGEDILPKKTVQADDKEKTDQADAEKTVQANVGKSLNGDATLEEEVHSTKNPKSSGARKKNSQKEYKINTSISNNIVIQKTKKIVSEDSVPPSDTELEKIKALADEFEIKFKPSGGTTCSICNNRIGDTYKDIKTHIASVKHKKKYFKTSKISPNNYDTARMQDYHKQSLMAYNIIRSSMVLNMRFCIDVLSYQVFVNEKGRLHCYLCNKTVEDGQQHSQLDLHKRLWGNCLVITSLDQEFVREVKKGAFHCGFCNTIFFEWETLLEHLMSRSHRKFKMAADKAAMHQIRILVGNQLMANMRQFVV